MKKYAVAAALLALATGTAHAEQKLLVTDVLSQKQVELQANVEYFSSRGNLSIAGEPGKLKQSAIESRIYGGIGVGFGAEVSMSVPYLFYEHERVDAFGETEFGNRDGLGDLAIGVKKELGELHEIKLVAGLDLKFDSASESNGGTGTTDVAPYLAASKELGHHFVPYGSYRPIFRNHGAPDSHLFTVGFEKELSRNVTLDVKGDVAFNTSSGNEGSPYQTYDLEVGSYLQIARNFYVIPSIAFFSSTKHDKDDVEIKAVSGYRPGVALYYLF